MVVVMVRCRRCGTEDEVNFSISRRGKSNHFVQPLCKLCTKPGQKQRRKMRKELEIKQKHLEAKKAGQLFFFEVA